MGAAALLAPPGGRRGHPANEDRQTPCTGTRVRKRTWYGSPGPVPRRALPSLDVDRDGRAISVSATGA